MRTTPNSGADGARKFKKKNGWVILDHPPGAPPLTNELLDQWEREDYDEEYRRAFSPAATNTDAPPLSN